VTERRSWSTLDVRIDGPVATVRFDRPDRRNTVTTAMVTEMHAVLTALRDDETLSVVVLTGAGGTFCPGADLRETGTEGPVELPDVAAYQSATLLHEMPQLTLAAVNGACAGAGLAWAVACDLRVATAGARFSTAFLELGLAGELGLPWTLPRAIGSARAYDLCFLPRAIGADEALVLGLLSRVFPDDRFAEESAALIGELAGREPTAVRQLKAHFRLAAVEPLDRYVQLEAEHQLTAFGGAERLQTLDRMRAQRDRVLSPSP
jgi:2-(1,2-epoxy-1,2-dihydrophenyl)acetyl-CoA isomerase